MKLRRGLRRILWALIAVGLLLWLSPVTVIAGSLSLAWDPNTEEDLAGYKVYIGTSSGTHSQTIDVGKATAPPALKYSRETFRTPGYLKTLFVLWRWMTHPWHLGPIPMTPGWHATKSIFDSAEACSFKAQTLNEGANRQLVCVVAGEAPEGGPVARLAR